MTTTATPSPTTFAPRTWNYRIRAYTFFHDLPGIEPEQVHELISVYYDADGTPIGWAPAAGPTGETLDQLESDIAKMNDAFNHPVLTDADLPGSHIAA